MSKIDEAMQVVDCGAVVRLDDMVLQHGVIFVHPDLPLFKLFMEIDPEKGVVAKYAFELVKPQSDEVKQFAIRVREAGDDSPLLLPEDKKVLLP